MSKNTFHDREMYREMYRGIEGIGDVDAEVLSYIHKNGPEVGPQKDIRQNLDVSAGGLSKSLNRLRDKGYVKCERLGRSKVYSVSEAAKNAGGVALKGREMSGVSEVPRETEDNHGFEWNTNVHDLAVKLPVDQGSVTGEVPREVILGDIDFSGLDISEDISGLDLEDWVVRLDGDSVHVYAESYSGSSSVSYLKDRFMQDVRALRTCIQKGLKVRLKDSCMVEASVFSQDVGLEDHPLVLAARRSDLDVRNARMRGRDSDGDSRLVIDLSHGDMGELESMMRGPGSSDKDLQESDMEFLLDRYAWSCENKDADVLMRRFSEFLASEFDGFDGSDSSGPGNDPCIRRRDKRRPEIEREGGPVCGSVSIETSDSAAESGLNRAHVYEFEDRDYSVMSVAEGLKGLDVRDLPGSYVDLEGEEWLVHHVAYVGSSVSEDSEDPVVVLRREVPKGTEELRVDLESLKAAVLEVPEIRIK